MTFQMKWGVVGLTALSMSLMSFQVRAQTLPEQTTTVTPTEITFFCGTVEDVASDGQLHVTKVWIPQRQGSLNLIAWKSEFFSSIGWKPENRCKAVSEKFDRLYKAGNLDYLAVGNVNGYAVICGLDTEEALSDKQELCNSDNQLFQAKPHDYPNTVLDELTSLLKGQTSNMSYQNSSSGARLIPIKEILDKIDTATNLDQDVPQCQVGPLGGLNKCG